LVFKVGALTGALCLLLSRSIRRAKTMNMTPATVDSKAVLSSGTLVSRADQTVVLFPLPVPHTGYKVELHFSKTHSGQPAISVQVSDFVKITFENFRQDTDLGNGDALHVANHLGRKVLMDVVTRLVGHGDSANRVTSYTFFDGGAHSARGS
jgi:hypothetical protein